MFFLETGDHDACLTLRDSFWRKSCNASHPLSQFLITNAKRLKEKVPGLFSKILHSMAEDDADKMISTVNDVLERLKHVPNLEISIPADLKLSEADFVKRRT